MKEFKIDPKIESQVEAMFLVAKQASDIKEKYPACWSKIKAHFRLGDFSNRDFTEKNLENFKIALYAEIVKQNDLDEQKKESKIKEELKK